MNSLRCGINSFLGQNYGITRPFMLPQDPIPSRLYMADNPPISYGNNKTPHNEVEQMLKERDLALNALKENLNIARNQMKKMAD